MTRRRFIGLSAAGLAALAGGGAGWLAYRIRNAEHPHFTTLAQVRAWLHTVEPSALQSTGAWSPSQVFNHCAQSLEYSIAGFPEPKPAWFQATLGAAAFRFFRSNGGMKHNLAEPVPGSKTSDLDSDLPAAIARSGPRWMRSKPRRTPSPLTLRTGNSIEKTSRPPTRCTSASTSARSSPPERHLPMQNRAKIRDSRSCDTGPSAVRPVISPNRSSAAANSNAATSRDASSLSTRNAEARLRRAS